MAKLPAATTRQPWYHPWQMAKRLVFCILVAYLFICVYLAAMQSRMIYAAYDPHYPIETAFLLAKGVGLVPWNPTPSNRLEFKGFVSKDFEKPTPRGTVIVFHGNGEYAWMRPGEVRALAQRGFRVFAYEYPGYGGRPGIPSEATIVPDARAVIRTLDQDGLGPIYVLGQSLGAGVAAAVCADPTLPIHGAGLITAWDNIANVGQAFYPWLPVRLLMIDKYDSIANLQNFPHPICIMRSENDEIIPPALSLNLFAHLPEPKKIILFKDCGHNDWPEDPRESWWDDALNFIAPKS